MNSRQAWILVATFLIAVTVVVLQGCAHRERPFASQFHAAESGHGPASFRAADRRMTR